MRFPHWLFNAIYYSCPVWTVVLAYVSVPLLVVRLVVFPPVGQCELRLG